MESVKWNGENTKLFDTSIYYKIFNLSLVTVSAIKHIRTGFIQPMLLWIWKKIM